MLMIFARSPGGLQRKSSGVSQPALLTRRPGRAEAGFDAATTVLAASLLPDVAGFGIGLATGGTESRPPPSTPFAVEIQNTDGPCLLLQGTLGKADTCYAAGPRYFIFQSTHFASPNHKYRCQLVVQRPAISNAALGFCGSTRGLGCVAAWPSLRRSSCRGRQSVEGAAR